MVSDSRFEGFGAPKPAIPDPGPGSTPRPWWEDLDAGRDAATCIDVPLDFVPGMTGMRIIQPGGGSDRVAPPGGGSERAALIADLRLR